MENYQELNIDQEFWADFIVEAFEHINDIESNVLTLEQNPDDMEIIHTMFRAFHTIKGLSGFVEHTVIQEIAHKTETVMDYCRKGEMAVNTKIVDAILKSSDYIKLLCEEVDAYKDQSFISKVEVHLGVLEELANVGESPVSTPAPEATVEAEAVIEPVANEQTYEEAKDEPKEEIQGENLLEFARVELEAAEVTENEEEEPSVVIKDIDAFANEVFVIKDEEEKETAPATEFEHGEQGEVEAARAETVFNEPVASENVEHVQVEEVKPEPVVEKVAPPVIEPPKPAVNVAPPQMAKPKVEAPVQNAETATVKKLFASSEDYMKVANGKIDHLVDMIGELIINQSLIDQYISSNYSQDNQLITNMSGFLRITRELQSLSMSLRMVSFKSTFQKVSRIARDTIQELSKDVEFVTSGDNTEIDRAVTDKLLDPLVHLIKNAISHGVETDVQARINGGKNRKARVELNAYNKRGKIFIEIKDDGRGINTEIVYKKALEKGLIDPARNYSEEEIKEFILLPGFSTAEVVDNISGRGVGMDVVKTQILKIGGKVNIESTLGVGSVFTLEVPVNHAIMNGTIIEMRNQIFIIPTMNVKEILQPRDDQWIFTQGKRTMLRVREDIISIVPISTFFKGEKLEENVPLVILLEVNGEYKALPITNVINRQEVVVKPTGEEFSELKYISGMSILGTGKVSLILDIDYLFKKEAKV